MRCFICFWLLLAVLVAQDGRLILPSPHLHQYSGISPVSAAGDKIHAHGAPGAGANVYLLSSGKMLREGAPYAVIRWDDFDDDLAWVIGGESNAPKPNAIYSWRPSTGKFTKQIDYSGRFTKIDAGGTEDIRDGWFAFWAEKEHTVCGVDLRAKKTYCADYTAADPQNHLPGAPNFIDYTAITPKDSKSGLRYVLFLVSPAIFVYAVDEQAGRLRLIVRPETVFPAMGLKPAQNNDGNCDPGESCLQSSHGDVLTAPDGQVYWVTPYGLEDHVGIPGHTGNSNFCQSGLAMLRLNQGVLMTKPENYDGISGGGMKYISDGSCGETWPAGLHIGCARWGTWCAISYEGAGGSPKGHRGEEWLLGLDGSNIVFKRLGANGTDTNADYWSEPRGALTMDASQIIYDSDAGTQGKTHAVYLLPTGVSVSRPSKPDDLPSSQKK